MSGRSLQFALLSCLITCVTVGCGTTKQHTATEQLLMSDAVDGAVARIDFSPLKGQRVYFDTKYLQNYKGVGFVNAEYVTSSLRQQMVAAGLYLYEKPDEADFVLEGRIGTLGADQHEVVYGIPSTNTLNQATTAVAAVSGAPPVPGIPEIALIRRNDDLALAKIGIFAYERESRERVWQSGVSIGQSRSKDLWVFGAGPFQKGTIHDGGVLFAGSTLDVPGVRPRGRNGPIASYRQDLLFRSLESEGETQLADTAKEGDPKVQQASAEEPKTETK